jgi:hypothetical protein
MKREFVINRHGRDYVLYAGLLDEAHQQGLKSIKTQLLQCPSGENGHVAICYAEVTTDRGTFTGIGDADPGNVNRAMANALIRLAETRAKVRALRDAVNVGMVAIEELAESAPESLGVHDGADEAPSGIVSLASVRQHVQQAQQGRLEAATSATGGATDGDAAEPGRRTGEERPGIAEASERLPEPAVPGAARTASSAPGERRIVNGRAGAAATSRAAGPSGGKTASDGGPLPPTQTQLETIAKLARSVGRAVTSDGLTRASASELITRLSEERYGARRPV